MVGVGNSSKCVRQTSKRLPLLDVPTSSHNDRYGTFYPPWPLLNRIKNKEAAVYSPKKFKYKLLPIHEEAENVHESGISASPNPNLMKTTELLAAHTSTSTSGANDISKNSNSCEKEDQDRHTSTCAII